MQASLPFAEPARVVERLPKPTEPEKVAQRATQHGKCAICGGASKGGAALDVVRQRDGTLIAYCRSHRLKEDAVERCAKAAAHRRRWAQGTKRKPGQARLEGIG